MADRPTPAEVRKARKADLVAWCTSFDLDAEGKVDELRARLLEFLAKPAEEEAAPKPKAPAKEEPEVEEPEEEEAEEEKAEEEEEEKGEGKEKGEHVPKAKPHLEPTTRQLLALRRELARRRPRFLRQEWFRHQRLGEIWRMPKGMHSKLKRHWAYRINVPSIGYRGPKAVRGLHPSGFREILVHTVRELEAVDPKVQAVRIGGTVGGRRRAEIEAAADEKGIRVLNRRAEE
ncbi:MAG TPA: 50S ribosomal protein L32e [Thermoplasmata archaeon]|jgi:large subunit ribosomal protein L32e|nr:50S ribosomal protein L32e [Thermoplasmata archaeon]